MSNVRVVIDCDPQRYILTSWFAALDLYLRLRVLYNFTVAILGELPLLFTVLGVDVNVISSKVYV